MPLACAWRMRTGAIQSLLTKNSPTTITMAAITPIIVFPLFIEPGSLTAGCLLVPNRLSPGALGFHGQRALLNLAGPAAQLPRHCRRHPQGYYSDKLGCGEEMIKDKAPVLVPAQEFNEETGHAVKGKVDDKNLAVVFLFSKPPKQNSEY